jgi:hypothetical protein
LDSIIAGEGDNYNDQFEREIRIENNTESGISSEPGGSDNCIVRHPCFMSGQAG